MNKIPVGKTIAYAYAFTFGHLGTVIGLAWLPVAATCAANYFLTKALYTTPPGTDPAVAAANAFVNSTPLVRLAELAIGVGVYALLIFLGAVVAVAMVRQALGMRVGGAVVHFAAGRDEWRMFFGHVRYLAALFAVVILFYVGLVIVGMVSGILAGAAGAQSPIAAGVVGLAATAGALVIGGAAVFTLVRMGFLLSPSIVAERKGGIMRSYDLTKGNFWRSFFVIVAVGLPPVAVVLFGEYELIWSHLNLDLSHLPTDQSAATAELVRRFNALGQAMQGEMLKQNLWIQVLAFVYGVLAAGLGYSASAFAYRALVPPAAGAH